MKTIKNPKTGKVYKITLNERITVCDKSTGGYLKPNTGTKGSRWYDKVGNALRKLSKE